MFSSFEMTSAGVRKPEDRQKCSIVSEFTGAKVAAAVICRGTPGGRRA
jgi:hypothetical protein